MPGRQLARKVQNVRQDSSAISPAPDFKPIELAKLKAFLRAARPRTFEHVCRLVAIALELFTTDECLAYARHCSYRAMP
jgi:hypothetical protein